MQVIVADNKQIIDAETRFRYAFFVKGKHNSIDELTVMFCDGKLYFSDTIPEKDIAKYGKIFKDFATKIKIDGKKQLERYDAIISRFGKDGESAVVEMLSYFRRLREENMGRAHLME